MEAISEHLAEVLKTCIERGMQLPFVLCAASPNGSVLCVRFNDSAGPDTLAEHFEPEGFRVPVTLMVLDQTGEAVRITINAERVIFH
jgi:hypothetical protein